MTRVLVSACLLNVNCRYNAQPAGNSRVTEEAIKRGWIPVCPEVFGGLPTPRSPGERIGDKVVTEHGEDLTEPYTSGAKEVLKLAQLYGSKFALLKERSPSCGHGVIYDGTFTHTRVPGDGIAAQLLEKNGIQVFGETELERLLILLDTEE